jgi:D-glycero-alpha-D-manno-heptose-7-phosphate kinase
MIITRSPLRVSLGGGGTDLPSYYREHEGFLIAAAINKYACITLQRPFYGGIILKYSKMERVSAIDEIQHPIIREALRFADIPNPNFEIDSIGDVPAGTGLGSSGSFTCALLTALHTYKKDTVSPKELAEEACHIEIDMLHEPIGKQDQYISAYGGLNAFTFRRDGDVRVEPLKLSDETLNSLEDNLLLFYTGFSRPASEVLKEQDDRSRQNDQSMLDNLHFVKSLGLKSKSALESGDLDGFADLMNVHWEYKKQRSKSMSNGKIDEWYSLALKNGAKGGKIVGAGGGGMLMFYAEDSVKLRRAMAHEGLRELHFGFDFEGSKVVTQS